MALTAGMFMREWSQGIPDARDHISSKFLQRSFFLKDLDPMFNSFQHSGSYDDLLKLMTQRAEHNEIDRKLIEILQQFFEKELEKDSMVLSRSERVRLFRELSKAILTNAISKN